MSNAHIECITTNLRNSSMDTALVKDGNSAPFPNKNFSGYCYIRKASDPFYVGYRLRVNYGKPARLLIKMTSVTIESSTQDLDTLWNIVSEIETKKRQKNKELSR